MVQEFLRDPGSPFGGWGEIHFPTYLCNFLHVFQPQTNGLDLEADMRIHLSSVTSDIRRLAKIKNNANSSHKIVFVLEYIVILH